MSTTQPENLGSAESLAGENGDGDVAAPTVWAGGRLVGLVAVVAVVSLLVGILSMKFIVSPADIAAGAAEPEAGPVTALDEERVIENTLTVRGEVTYADPTDVTIDASFAEGRPIVTGQATTVGETLGAAAVALEIVGRPVIVLPGELPAYRSLSIGMSGPDVTQLKEALASLGFDSGNMDSDVYQWATATAVGKLYDQVRYSSNTGGEEAAEQLRLAQANLRAADTAVTGANAAWRAAADAGATDLSMENAAIEEAKANWADAYTELETAQVANQPTLPSGEVLFVKSLPRRVDGIYVARGDTLEGMAMTLSGATLTVQGTVGLAMLRSRKPGWRPSMNLPAANLLLQPLSPSPRQVQRQKMTGKAGKVATC